MYNPLKAIITMSKSTITHDRQTVVKRLIALGLRPIAACSFADQVLKWARSCGEEWCVSHLKDLKQQKIRCIAGLPLHPGLPRPKGAVKHVFRCSDRVSLDCLNIYTMFINHGAPTQRQLNKFLGSMQKPLVVSEEYERTLSSLCRFATSYGKAFRGIYRSGSRMEIQFVDTFTTDHQTVSLMRTHGLESWGSSPGKRAPSDMFRYKTTPEDQMSTLDHMFLVSQPGLKMYPWDRAVSEAYQLKANQGMFPLSEFSNQDRDPDFEDDSWFGVVSFIQEAGYKLRAIANPVRPVQALLSRMGFGLYDVLKSLKEDYTHNHEAGVGHIQEQLKHEGAKLFSVDLSDATNNLPLDPQLALLKALGCEQWEIDLFHHSSRGQWSLPPSAGGGLSRWTVGQPLGVYPSFASFALMHHMICEYALYRVMRKHHVHWSRKETDPSYLKRWILRKGPSPKFKSERTYVIRNGRKIRSIRRLNEEETRMSVLGLRSCLVLDNCVPSKRASRPWAIIGDDLVIFDEEVYLEYRTIIDALQVPVSEEKTLISDQCAEFAKRIITAKSVILPYKWTPVGDFAVKAYLEKVGPKGFNTLTERQQRLVRKYLELPQPLGLGWNPKGRPMRNRVSPEMMEWIRKGCAPFVPPRDDESPMTNVLKKDISDFWFVGTGLKEACASESHVYPSRIDSVQGLYESLDQCGLPIVHSLAELLYEHLVYRNDRRNYQFDDDSFIPLMRLYQRKLCTIDRRGKPIEEIWPGSRAIDRALRTWHKQ